MVIKLREADKIKVLNGNGLYGIMQKILLRENEIDRNREHFWIVGLETNNRILFIELISLGTVNKTFAEPMEVFSLALQKRAVNIILVHNHPSGELKPSDADKDLTDRLIQVGFIVDTPVLDHLIISERSYLSFSDIGLLSELKQSTRWLPKYKELELIEKQAKEMGEKTGIEMGKKAGIEENRKEVAKKLKKKGVDIKTISETTGLTISEVEKIKVRRTLD